MQHSQNLKLEHVHSLRLRHIPQFLSLRQLDEFLTSQTLVRPHSSQALLTKQSDHIAASEETSKRPSMRRLSCWRWFDKEAVLGIPKSAGAALNQLSCLRFHPTPSVRWGAYSYRSQNQTSCIGGCLVWGARLRGCKATSYCP